MSSESLSLSRHDGQEEQGQGQEQYQEPQPTYKNAHTDARRRALQTDRYIETPWNIISSYFNNKHLDRLVRHQLESYNKFVTEFIPATIEMFNPVSISSDQDYDRASKRHALTVQVSFDNFSVHRPQIHENNGATQIMFPQKARLRNFTYASTMTVDICVQYIVRTGENLNNLHTMQTSFPGIHIGKLPIMLKSNICVLTQYPHLSTAVTGECSHDAGGYFIINGSEKTVLCQERAAENKVYCFNVSKGNTKWNWIAETKSVPDYKQISPKQVNVMIASKSNGNGYPIYVQVPRIKTPISLFVLFRALGVISDKAICEMILLTRCDSTTAADSEAETLKELLDALSASIIDANNVLTREDALRIISSNAAFGHHATQTATATTAATATSSASASATATAATATAATAANEKETTANKRRMDFVSDILANDLFPHCRTEKQKVYFLGYAVLKLIRVSLGQLPQDDRDSYLNKRIDTTGVLLNNLFRNYFHKVVKDMTKQVIREINTGSWRSTENHMQIITRTNIAKIIKSTTIENGLKRALSTGDFGIKSMTPSTKVGVAQVLNRLTYVSSLSHLRRVSTPIDKSGKLVAPRKLNPSTWGYFCPAETPEGGSVGVVKNISYMTHITVPISSETLYLQAESYMQPLDACTSPRDAMGKVKVFINGAWVGITDDPVRMFQDFKTKKMSGLISVYCSVVFDYRQQEIRICNDGGRLTRPLLRIKDDMPFLTSDTLAAIKDGTLEWDDFMTNMRTEQSIIEYIDPDEQNYSMVAMTHAHLKANMDVGNPSARLLKYTHCEIHPSTIFGVLASCIPFPDHNQAPRNTYQCAMGKQAMGVYVTNYHSRLDKTAYVLSYPSRPLVDTRLMGMIKLDEIPSGGTIIVAIMTHTGYNQEDSVLVNKGSIDRGMFMTTIYHTERDEDKKINGDEEIRCRPDPKRTKGMKFGNYDKVNARGVIPENTLVENRDIIIAKVVPIKENRNDPTKVIKYEDASRIYRTTEETYVDKAYMDRNGEGYCFAKVRTRALRKPVIGDKFSSRHGQKGTCGNIIPECDMPYTKDGIRPDIIINPHAIPSRMTIGQLKETLLGKLLVQLGLFGDGTSFGELEIDDISTELLRLGFEKNGNELLYSGLTGEQIESDIFMGPVFYQRLKHMVTDKQHSRSIGPMVNLTRQPAEGRSRDGGFRFGEMERDCTVAHGASRFTRGRLYDCSDKYQVHVCRECGMIAVFNDVAGVHVCRTCDNRTDFALVQIPYACKLLFQELQTMNVVPRIVT
jgi:DNA-directed RNA polymerase II subunit RPB2